MASRPAKLIDFACTVSDRALTVDIPVVIKSPQNGASHRGHWAIAGAKSKKERGLARTLLIAHLRDTWVRESTLVTLTRFAPRMLDRVQLYVATKAYADGVFDVVFGTDGEGSWAAGPKWTGHLHDSEISRLQCNIVQSQLRSYGLRICYER